jgi:chromosomal replication initiator protein
MMFDARKQIIITSDRKPQDLKGGFQDRLISRFEWGVIADIGQPSMELRLAILRHKAQKQQVYVPDDVLRFLAENIPENIRRLEGALIGMLAKSLTENIPLTIDNVRTMLKDMIDSTPRTVSIERIIAALEEEFRIPRRELLSRKRSSQLALARQFGMYLAKMLTDLPYLAISEHFGRRDHTTAYHAYLKIKNLIDTNPYYAQLVNNLTKKVRP